MARRAVGIALTAHHQAAFVDTQATIPTVAPRKAFGNENALALDTLLVEGALLESSTLELLLAGTILAPKTLGALVIGATFPLVYTGTGNTVEPRGAITV